MSEAVGGSMGYEYSTLMNMLHVSVSKHRLDDHFTLIWANDFYYELIGYVREEYEAEYHNQCDRYYVSEELGIDDGDVWRKISEAVTTAMKQGEAGYTCVSRMRRKDGGYIWVRMSGSFIEEYIDGVQLSYTVMTDISDIMQMQIERSVTYDNLPGFVAKYRIGQDYSFNLLEANDRFLDFFGEGSWQSDAYALQQENVDRNAPAFEAHREEILAGKPVHFTVHMAGQRGGDAWLQINAACVGYQDGDPVYQVLYIDITDETELRQMQAQLERQAQELRAALGRAEEASRAKSDFLSRMSHDIRTPMNAVLGMADIAAAHIDDRDKVRDCLKKISLSGQHLLGLINDVLDMSKIESGKMALHCESMSLPEVLENVVAIMQPQFKERAQRFSIRLHCVTHEQFYSDSLRLRQVFINILSNACKFTPNGGSVTMDVREEALQGEIAPLVFTFSDTGIGMEEEFLEHLFDAFSRERDSRVDKTEGSGLGMAIMKRIVDLLGGTVEVFSQPGKGTTFCVRLPMKVEGSLAAGEKLPDLRVLVADDDAFMCEHTVDRLRALGVDTDWVDNGVDAVDRFRAAHARGADYDAVILDWKMPGLDGVQTTRRIRELCGDGLPILIVSAYDWNDIEREAREAGVTGFLPKPVFLSSLCRALQRYVLGREQAADAADSAGGPEFTGRRFLLAEDNTLNREVALELLGDMGATVDVAVNGAEGVAAFARAPAGYYDLILMDVQMPVMDGYTATRRIRALARPDAAAVPILAMTADAFAEDIGAAKEAGMNGHMAKPLDGAALRREIGRYLRRDAAQ